MGRLIGCSGILIIYLYCMKLATFTRIFFSLTGFSVLGLEAGELGQQFNEVARWNYYGEVKQAGKELVVVSAGDKVLANIPAEGKRRKAKFINTREKYRDLHMKLEFMIPKGSNSGVYFMGRYEIQILDSFSRKRMSSGDLGGLYQRYDERRNPKGFEGVRPRVNASKAPGEWQTMEVIFRAPRFAADGSKTHHAKFVKVLVNGKLVHENQVAKGPTRSSRFKDESAGAESIYIQGDHGPVAIRKIEVKPLSLSVEGEPVLTGADIVPLDVKGHAMVNLVEVGKRLFTDKGCIECHGVAAGQVKTGPSQYGVFTLKGRDVEVIEKAEGKRVKRASGIKYLTDSLRRPASELSVKADGTSYLPIMPPYDYKALNDADILALHSYLVTLNPKGDAGPSVLWREKPNPKYDINKDAIAVYVKDFPRLERVEMGESVSGRAYHVGLPGDLSYTFDPRSMAIARVWDGPFIRKKDQVGRGNGHGEMGFKHREYSGLANLFQAYDGEGKLVDLTYASPARMKDEKQAAEFLQDTSDFLAQARAFPAKFLGVKTPKQGVPRFRYSVGENVMDMEFVIGADRRVEAKFGMKLKRAQQFLIPEKGLVDVSVSVGEIKDGRWTVPAGDYASVVFKAGLPSVAGAVYTSDISAKESYAPQELKWVKSSKAARLPKGYAIEDGSAPKDPFGRDLVFEPLGIEFYKDKVFVTTRTAGVWKIVDGKWHLFAEGAYESIGLVVNSEGDVVIGEKGGLTRLVDKDGDHWSEERVNLTDQFRFTGDYHEYLHGPIKRDGEYLFTLNLANHAAGMYKAKGVWMGTVGGLRGWMLSCDDEGNTKTYASGFRSPAGLSLSPDNEIVYTENQGEYVGTSKLFKVKRGKFYGNPTGLLDTPGQNVDSPETKWEAVKDSRELPVVLFPHGRVMNGPGSPEFLTDKVRFGPFEGQMFVGDQTKSNIYRVDTEVVDGQEQGVVIPFADQLKSGAMRLRFDPADSSLWIGQTGRGWRSQGGYEHALQRIVFDVNSKVNAIKTVRVTGVGFDVHFTQPQDGTEDYGGMRCSSWFYANSHEYGSKQYGRRDEKVSRFSWNAEKTVCSIELENFSVGEEASGVPTSSDSSRVYFIDLEKTAFSRKAAPHFAKAYYTLHRIPKK